RGGRRRSSRPTRQRRRSRGSSSPSPSPSLGRGRSSPAPPHTAPPDTPDEEAEPMHVFAITQGAILNVFDEVLERLRRTGAVERVSWYVAGRSAYRRWIEQGAQAT